MTILLLTLFVIALTIIGVGLWLSPRAQTSRDVFPVERNIRVRRVYGARQPYAPRRGYRTGQVQVRYPTVEYERGNWTNSWGRFGSLLNVKNLFGQRAEKPTPWLGLLLILIALFGIGLFSLRGFLLDPGIIAESSWLSAPLAPPRATPASVAPTAPALPFSGLAGASQALARVYQLDPNQYASMQDYNKWAYSACSAAAMTEVINSYGHSYHIKDILSVEARLGEITPDLGLVEPSGIDHTVSQFGFKTVTLKSPALNDIINIGNQGRPVIVSFPPDRWDGGHLLVVRGGNSSSVYLADSSRYNMTVMARSTFMKYWGGFAVVAVPNK